MSRDFLLTIRSKDIRGVFSVHSISKMYKSKIDTSNITQYGVRFKNCKTKKVLLLKTR